MAVTMAMYFAEKGYTASPNEFSKDHFETSINKNIFR